MQIEAKVGKKYKDRQGRVHEIVTLISNSKSGYIATCDKGWHYTSDGKLYTDYAVAHYEMPEETEFDLIEEVK